MAETTLTALGGLYRTLDDEQGLGWGDVLRSRLIRNDIARVRFERLAANGVATWRQTQRTPIRHVERLTVPETRPVSLQFAAAHALALGIGAPSPVAQHATQSATQTS